MPSIRYFTLYSYSIQYVLDILALKLIWRLALSVQVSSLMVFTVHGIVPPSCCIYFLGLHPQKYIHVHVHPLHGTYHIHCKNHETTITCKYMYIHIHAHIHITGPCVLLYTCMYFLLDIHKLYTREGCPSLSCKILWLPQTNSHLRLLGSAGGRQNRTMRVGKFGADPPILGWAVEREMEAFSQSSPVHCLIRP